MNSQHIEKNEEKQSGGSSSPSAQLLPDGPEGLRLSLPELRGGAREATHRALRNLARRQEPGGSWKGDYGGPMFLLPMYVIACRVTEQPIPAPRRQRMREYLQSAQGPDGAVGLHVEGEGSLFTTVLCYVALRLLGEAAGSTAATRMRSWLRSHGTPLRAAPWAKWVLSILNLYDYRGLNPVPPETWLLPYSFPVHPGRLWCHCRQVYLPMSYLYGARAQIPLAPDIEALRAELYDQPYAEIRWTRYRDAIRRAECYTPLSPMMRAANAVLRSHEELQQRASAGSVPRRLRQRALDEVMHHVRYEDDVTQHLDIGPVNSVLNVLCHHFEEPGSERFRQGFAALEAYLWDGHDGMKFQGYESSELWDTAFAAQAIEAALPLSEDAATTAGAAEALERAHGYVRDNQILEDVPECEAHYRDPSRGGWPFSSRPHGWPITDCTAEGFKVAVHVEDRVAQPVDPERLRDAVRLILGWQNPDGGWPSYERKRAGDWVELLNPSFVFGDIMVDYSYPECTSACLQALAVARHRFFEERHREAGSSPRPRRHPIPGFTRAALDSATARGERYLREQQRPDGSWYGSWGICFTYGTWFGTWGLRAAGAHPGDSALVRAASFLLSHQRPDGAWGEHHRACAEQRWVDHPEGQVVMTAWALLGLMATQPDAGQAQGAGAPSGAAAGARAPGRDPAVERALDRGVAFLLRRQADDGSWPREAIAGMFNRTCAITYDNYRHYFPLWALARWLEHRGDSAPGEATHRATRS